MKNSKQRNEILKSIIDSCDHPNAETIYLRVKKIMPNISLGTIYRNLCLLVNQGLIRQICISYGPNRYDKTLKEHYHFFCRECGDLSDVEYHFPATDIYHKMSEESCNKFDGMELTFSGICKNCLNKNTGN